jgi:hypothetical protein
MSLIDCYADAYANLTAAAAADGWDKPLPSLVAECAAARAALVAAIREAFCLHQTLACAVADPATYYGGTAELGERIAENEKRIGLTP